MVIEATQWNKAHSICRDALRPFINLNDANKHDHTHQVRKSNEMWQIVRWKAQSLFIVPNERI